MDRSWIILNQLIFLEFYICIFNDHFSAFYLFTMFRFYNASIHYLIFIENKY
jgi:hypothetical protein